MIRRWLAAQFRSPGGWAGRLFIAPWLDRISRDMNRLALSELGLAGGERVLEVGFGGGALLRMMLAAGAAAVAGADVSTVAVERARRRTRGEFAQASAEALPFANAAFDAAVSVNSLYFWPDPAAAFAELARVVRPGGRLVLCFEPPEELRKWPGHRHGFRLFEPVEVAALASASGFENVGFAEGHGRKPDRFLCLSATRGNANH